MSLDIVMCKDIAFVKLFIIFTKLNVQVNFLLYPPYIIEFNDTFLMVMFEDTLILNIARVSLASMLYLSSDTSPSPLVASFNF